MVYSSAPLCLFGKETRCSGKEREHGGDMSSILHHLFEITEWVQELFRRSTILRHEVEEFAFLFPKPPTAFSQPLIPKLVSIVTHVLGRLCLRAISNSRNPFRGPSPSLPRPPSHLPNLLALMRSRHSTPACVGSCLFFVLTKGQACTCSLLLEDYNNISKWGFPFSLQGKTVSQQITQNALSLRYR